MGKKEKGEKPQAFFNLLEISENLILVSLARQTFLEA